MFAMVREAGTTADDVITSEDPLLPAGGNREPALPRKGEGEGSSASAVVGAYGNTPTTGPSILPGKEGHGDRLDHDASLLPPLPVAGEGREPALPGKGDGFQGPTSFANRRYWVSKFLGEGGKKRVYLARREILRA